MSEEEDPELLSVSDVASVDSAVLLSVSVWSLLLLSDPWLGVDEETVVELPVVSWSGSGSGPVP